MATLFIHKDLYNGMSRSMQGITDLTDMHNKITDMFTGSGKDPINFGSMPLIIMTRDDVSQGATSVPNGRAVFLNNWGNKNSLDVIDANSIAFSPNDYVQMRLGNLAQLESNNQIDEFYSILQKIDKIKTTRVVGSDDNFEFLTDLVFDAISLHKNGVHNSELLRAEAQFLHDVTDVKGFSFSSFELDDEYRILLTGGDDTSENVFGTGSKKVVVKSTSRFQELLSNTRALEDTVSGTSIGPYTDIYTLTDDEIGKVNKLLLQHHNNEGGMTMELLEKAIIKEIGGEGSGAKGVLRRRVAGIKIAQYISMGAEQLGSRAHQTLESSPIMTIYERLSGGDPITISETFTPGVNGNRLYLDVTPYQNLNLLGYIFEDDIIPISNDELLARSAKDMPDIVVPSYHQSPVDQSLAESMHKIIDSSQGHDSLINIIEDLADSSTDLEMASLDIETPTDISLSKKLYKEGFLLKETDKPIISVGMRDTDNNVLDKIRRLSEKEASIWKEHYINTIQKARNSAIWKQGQKWKKNYGSDFWSYIQKGEINAPLSTSFENMFGDITKWVGGIYGTNLYDPKSIKGKGLIKNNSLFKTLSQMVLDVKGDKFDSAEGALAHFMRLSDKGRINLFNEWMIKAPPWEIARFFDEAEDAMTTAIGRMSDFGSTTDPRDLLSSVLRHVTAAYDPDTGVANKRLRADIFDIKGIEGLYNLLKNQNNITSEIETNFEKFINMQRVNVSETLQIMSAVAKHHGITETTGGLKLPTSGAIDKLIQSGYLPDDVTQHLIDEGALWSPGNDVLIEPHIGTHDISLAAAIDAHSAAILNAEVIIDGKTVPFKSLVSHAIDINNKRFTWQELIEGVNTKEGRQHVFFSRQKAIEVTPETASDFGIDYYNTKKLNEGGTMFADNKMYPIGGRSTVRVIDIEKGFGGKDIVTFQDAVTERRHKVVYEEGGFANKFAHRLDAQYSTDAKIAVATWEDTVLKGFDEYRRTINEMVTGKSRTPKVDVNAPERLREMFSLRGVQKLSETKGVDFWDMYTSYKKGDITSEPLIRQLRDIEESIRTNIDISKRGMSVSKVLTEAMFFRHKDFWKEDMAVRSQNIEGPVTLMDETIDLVLDSNRGLDIEEMSYKNRNLVDITSLGDSPFRGTEARAKGIEQSWNSLIDKLNEKGFIPGADELPTHPDQNIVPTAADYRATRLEKVERAIIPPESDAINISTMQGKTRSEALSNYIKQKLKSNLDITDPDILDTPDISHNISTLANIISGQDRTDRKKVAAISDKLGYGPKMIVPKIEELDPEFILRKKIDAAKRIAEKDNVRRSDMFPMAQAFRDLKQRGSITGILDNINDPIVNEFIHGGEFMDYLNQMDMKTLSSFAGNVRRIGTLPPEAAPIKTALRTVVSNVFNIPNPTNRGLGERELLDYLPPTFSPDDVKPVRSYADDVARSISDNITPKTILGTAAALGGLAMINSAFVDKAPEKHRIKGSGYVTPSGEYIDDPTLIETHIPGAPQAVQGRGFRMRISGMTNMVQATGLASGMRQYGSTNIHEGNNTNIDNTNRKRIMDRMI